VDWSRFDTFSCVVIVDFAHIAADGLRHSLQRQQGARSGKQTCKVVYGDCLTLLAELRAKLLKTSQEKIIDAISLVIMIMKPLIIHVATLESRTVSYCLSSWFDTGSYYLCASWLHHIICPSLCRTMGLQSIFTPLTSSQMPQYSHPTVQSTNFFFTF
jgi:hypothetical protein